ncbi:hypothetical protein PVAP13_5KG300114 [Panicum virgatum]|uniref:Uncharacterized protein n=1 Tax=Panicum virgatum TaxID=38727 RepID=A0A8T0SFH8_PANVG|nr:hypothetical protein PVAP13_5KG300114 [Panicum virgatum]
MRPCHSHRVVPISNSVGAATGTIVANHLPLLSSPLHLSPGLAVPVEKPGLKKVHIRALIMGCKSWGSSMARRRCLYIYLITQPS